MSPHPVVDLPLLERQHIVVFPDSVMDADHDLYLRTRSPDKVDGTPWPWVNFKGKERDRGLHAIAEAHSDGVSLLPVRASEACDLEVPVGHPLPRTVYAASPAHPTRYYPTADFHRRVFESKFAEAVRLIMALGAREFRVEWERGWRDDLAAEVELSVKKVANVRGSLEASAAREQSLLFEAHMVPGPPRLPEGLIWYHHEPTWQAVAEGRLNNRMTELRLFVRSTEDYNVNAEFVTKVLRRKVFGLGGEFTRHVETTWRIEGTFEDAPRGHWWQST